jgi:hypothetical protein
MKKEKIELERQDGIWVAYFPDSEEVVPTPFFDTTPFEIVQEKIQSKNPDCGVDHSGN